MGYPRITARRRKIKRNPDFIQQTVGGENILVPIGAQVVNFNGIITLNEVAAHVWGLLAEERTDEELAVAVAEEFDVEAETARADVRAFLDDIAKLGLLEQ